jgi:hypothetical protein
VVGGPGGCYSQPRLLAQGAGQKPADQHYSRNRQDPGRCPGRRAAKGPKKPRVAAHRPNVAPSKARSGHKATPAKKATKRATSAKSPKKKITGAHPGGRDRPGRRPITRVGGKCKLISMGIHIGGGAPVKANFGPRWGQMRADSGIWRFLAQNSATRRSRLLGGVRAPGHVVECIWIL